MGGTSPAGAATRPWGDMPTRFLTDAELAQLSGFPADIAAEDLVTYFSLEPDDRRWVVRDHRGQANRLGLPCSCAPCPGSASYLMT